MAPAGAHPYNGAMHPSITSPRHPQRERIAFMGEVVTVRLDAAASSGTLSLLEHAMPRGLATPLHVHPHEDEALLVLAGELTVPVCGAEQAAAAGDAVWLPRGVPHAFRVDADGATVLAITTPGGHETFFRAAGDPGGGVPAGPPDPERMERAAALAGIEILGPPPFEPS